MTASEWWTRARARWLDGDVTNAPEDIGAWHDLDHQDRQRVDARLKLGLRHADPSVRRFAHHVAEDIAVATMDTAKASDHLLLEIAAVHHRGEPLAPGDPVPGCACQLCTGVSTDDPARLPAWRRADPERAAKSDDERRRAWKRRVEAARRISIVDMARMLGCGDPVKRGRELVVRCPLHADDDPSCTVDPDKGVWYCFPCAEGGDAIDLFMRARRLDFAGAVKELAA